MEWKLRKAAKPDEPKIRALFIEMLQTIYAAKDVKGYEAGYLDRFFGGTEDWICVAESAGSVVAYLSIEVHRGQEPFIYLDDFSVSEAYRGKGIGTDMIKTAERFAEESGARAVVLHVEKTNRRALKLYGRMGYSVMNDEGTRLRMMKRISFSGCEHIRQNPEQGC